MTDSLPDRGHNNPPDLLPVLPPTKSEEELAAAFAKAKAEAQDAQPKDLAFDEATFFNFQTRVLDFCNAAGVWADLKTITSTAQSERLTDFVEGSRGLWKQVDTARKAAKQPWDDKATEVQIAFVPLLDKLKKVGDSMKAMQADWLQRETDRIAAEKAEAARIAREKLEAAQREAEQAAARNDFSGAVDAEAALKEAEKEVRRAEKPAAAKAGSASGGGRGMSLRTQAYAEIDNIRQVFMHFAENPRVIEVLQSLADAEIRAGNAVPGATRKERKVAA
jgi:hypothetical protein